MERKPIEDPERVHAALGSLRDKLRERFGARLVDLRLFGSYARGDFGPESDVDLLVVVDGLTWDEKGEVSDLTEDVYFDLQVPIASLAWSTEHARRMRDRELLIVSEIDRDGVPL